MFSKSNTGNLASLLALALLATGLVATSPNVAEATATCTMGSDQKGSAIGIDGTAANSGTDTNPFPISSPTDLLILGACITESKTSGVHYQQTSNIDLSGEANWQTLGSGSATGFMGTYSGSSNSQPLSITGMSISTLPTAWSNNYTLGLFGLLTSASVSNLIVEGAISISSAVSSGDLQVGGLAGLIKDSTISNVQTSVAISLDFGSNVRVGGVSGGFRRSTFSSVSALWNEGQGSITGTGTNFYAGGLLGRMYDSGNVTITNSFADIPIASTGSRFRTNLGGLVGAMLNLSGELSIYRSTSRSSLKMESQGGDSALGGLVGGVPGVSSVSISESIFQGLALFDYNSTSTVGGFVGGGSMGSNGTTISIFESQTSAAFYALGSSLFVGAISGTLANTADNGSIQVNMRDNFSNPIPINLSGTRYNRYNAVAGDVTENFSGETLIDEAWGGIGVTTGISTIPTASISDPANIPFSSFGTAGFDSTKIWNHCAVPYLTWTGNSGCKPSVTGAIVNSAGNNLQVHFSQNLDQTQTPDASLFGLEVLDGASIGLTNPTWGLSGRAIAFSLSQTVLEDYALKLSVAPGSSVRAFSSSELVNARTLHTTNLSSITGPVVQGLASSNLSPDSFDLAFTCGGSCDPSTSYDYVASITPAGGSATSQTATTTGTASISFNNLDPNVAHVISVTVTQGGLTSPAATSTVTTPKPAATISAISVLDTSATLTVGCTNCGAAPDSFTVSATPVAGGAAITSNTNVISGLASETTYSFSVVVAFAGTNSDLVLWQDNPVMTLPFVPVISAVSPVAVPLSGGTITVTGSNFTTSTELRLAGSTLSFTIVSGTEITFTAPSDTAGSYDLAITNPVGTFTLSNAVTYVAGPSLTTNSPLVGTVNGGTIVTLTGTDLGTTSKVELGPTTVSFSVVSETAVRFVSPAYASGVFDMSASPILDIKITTVGGSATLTNSYEYTSSSLVPVISTITPATGPTAGGTTITVTGQYFSGSYSDSVSAAINSISGSSLVLIDDSTLTFVSPAGAAAAGLDVTVATGGGLGTLAGAFTYTAPPATAGSAPPVVISTPTITEFSTREISASGAEVTANGLRLENISVLTLGGITITIVSNTATSLTFTTGEMPVGVWDLRLVGSNGTLVFQQAIEVVAAAAIVGESTGELLGWTWTLKFLGNSRSLHLAQSEHLTGKLDEHPTAETIICWGYTTAENPNAWAIAHATQRAQAACDLASANDSEVKTVVRLRYGVSKNWAMRSALQFWR